MDWKISSLGSIWLFTPNTPEATDWADEYLPDDCPMMGAAYAVEAHCAPPIIQALLSDGFTVSLDGREIEDVS